MSKKSIKSEASDIVNYLKHKNDKSNQENNKDEKKENFLLCSTDSCELRNSVEVLDHVEIRDIHSNKTNDRNLCKSSNYNLKRKLAEWSSDLNVPNNTVTALLKILQPVVPGLPLDCRSLKQTPRTSPVTSIGGGEYVHYGVADCLTDFFNNNVYTKNSIELNINIDGLPLFKASKMQTWPILINVNNTLPVLVAGFFTGHSKPTDVNEYLNDFVTELCEIIENGFNYHNKNFQVGVRAFICDAPARSFVMGVKYHTGYYSCIKCKQRGEFCEGKMTFCFEKNALRSNREYRNKTDAVFHRIKTPMIIEKLPIDVIKQFALDYMHVICLGVVKTLLNTWTNVKNKDYSLTKSQITMLEKNLLSLKCGITREFARKPRAISEASMWKAVEFRQFLLYTGPVVLKNILTKARYNHFLLLSVSTRILLDSDNCLKNNMCAKLMLNEFIKEIPTLYDKSLLVHNFHCLSHLADEVVYFKENLHSFGAYKFENYLHKVKGMVHNGTNVAAQIYSRIVEQSIHSTNISTINKCNIIKDSNGAIVAIHSELYFSKLYPDNYILVSNEIYKIESFEADGELVIVNGLKLLFKSDFFTLPIKSSFLYIYQCSGFKTEEERTSFSFSSITKKLILFEFQNSAIIFPIINKQ